MERVLWKEKEKGNINSVNYGITISSKDDCGMRLVTTTPGPNLRDAPGPSTINHREGGSGAVTASTGEASTSLRTTKS